MAHRSFLQAIGAVQRQSGGARPAAAATVAPVAASQPASASHAQPLHVDLDSESEVIDLDNQLSLRLVYPVRLLVRLPGGRTAQRIDMWQLLQRLQQAVGVDNLVDGALKQAAPSAELDQLAYEGLATSLNSYEKIKAILRSTLNLKFVGLVDAVQVDLDEAQSGVSVSRKQLEAAVEAARAAFPQGFQVTEPGCRPDTLCLTQLPRRWFSTPSAVPGAQAALEYQAPDPDKTATGREEDGSQRDTVVQGINLNVVARILQQFGRLRRLEFVLADARPEVTEGPGETLQISNVMTTVHMHPLAPALADTVSAAAFDQSLYFSVYVQYEQEEGVAAALSKLFGRLLVYEHPMRGKFSKHLQVGLDLTQRLSKRSIRQRRLAAQEVQLQKRLAAERKAREELRARRAAEEERRRAEEEARRKKEEERRRAAEEAERQRQLETARREQQARIEEDRRRRAEEARQKREAEAAALRAAEEERLAEERRRRAAEAAEARRLAAEAAEAQRQEEEERLTQQQQLLEEKARLEQLREQLAQEEAALVEAQRQKEAAEAQERERLRQEELEQERERQRLLAEKDELARKRRKMALARLRGEV